MIFVLRVLESSHSHRADPDRNSPLNPRFLLVLRELLPNPSLYLDFCSNFGSEIRQIASLASSLRGNDEDDFSCVSAAVQRDFDAIDGPELERKHCRSDLSWFRVQGSGGAAEIWGGQCENSVTSCHHVIDLDAPDEMMLWTLRPVSSSGDDRLQECQPCLLAWGRRHRHRGEAAEEASPDHTTGLGLYGVDLHHPCRWRGTLKSPCFTSADFDICWYHVDICDFGKFRDIHTVDVETFKDTTGAGYWYRHVALTFFWFSARHFKGSDPFDVIRSSWRKARTLDGKAPLAWSVVWSPASGFIPQCLLSCKRVSPTTL